MTLSLSTLNKSTLQNDTLVISAAVKPFLPDVFMLSVILPYVVAPGTNGEWLCLNKVERK